jgi:oxygen-independent coproporphyrinogen-3 oxidase
VPLGIYISVPFCRTKCSYCNFASDVFSRTVFARYVDRICGDIENSARRAAEMGAEIEGAVDSIYLGGGTPSVLEPAQLERIFAAVRCQFDVSPNAENTVECAPGSLSDEMLHSLMRCGVNRISLGVQSFVDQEAAAVGRLHKRATVLEDIARLRAVGITNINVDLIAGLPHQTAESWEFSLAETIAAAAPHVSVYMLEVDEDSRLGRELIAGGTRYHAHFVPDEDAVADFYIAACDRLEPAGVAQYEISNFACPGLESRHNLKYWTRQPYLGFGVDAHSMLPKKSEGRDFSRAASAEGGQPGLGSSQIEVVRFAFSDSLERYVNGARVQQTLVASQASLEESFFLSLRLNRGVNLRELAARYGEIAVENNRDAIAELIADGLIARQKDSISLTSRGRLLSNEVFQRFIAEKDVSL